MHTHTHTPSLIYEGRVHRFSISFSNPPHGLTNAILSCQFLLLWTDDIGHGESYYYVTVANKDVLYTPQYYNVGWYKIGVLLIKYWFISVEKI